MRRFYSEFAYSYDSYSFGYTIYGERERGDLLSEIYNQGFLPFSGSPAVTNVFYMARSVRIPLKAFIPSSENRRIGRKFEGDLTRRKIAKVDFDTASEAFETFCLDYFEKRHGPLVMPRERFRHLLTQDALTHIVVYEIGDKIMGYVFLGEDKQAVHYWYSFYDLELAHQSLGLFLMLEEIKVAQAGNKRYLYLGTAYGEKGLYKTNFPGLEFWNGESWSADIKKLRSLCRGDHTRVTGLVDAWKEGLELF